MKLKYTYFILIILLISSCKAKKEYIYTTKIDSVRVEKILKITPPQLNSIAIDSPCDSLGNLKPFNYTFENDKVKTKLFAKNDTIYLTQNIDSIVDAKVNEFKNSYENKESHTITEVVPKWCYYTILIIIILLIWIFKKPLLRLII